MSLLALKVISAVACIAVGAKAAREVLKAPLEPRKPWEAEKQPPRKWWRRE